MALYQFPSLEGFLDAKDATACAARLGAGKLATLRRVGEALASDALEALAGDPAGQGGSAHPDLWISMPNIRRRSGAACDFEAAPLTVIPIATLRHLRPNELAQETLERTARLRVFGRGGS